MPISKIFHDHIVMSNVDKHGVKQVLYPRTTSDDVLMSDGSTNLTTFARSVILDDGSVNMKQHLKFREAGQGSRPGLVMYDNDNNEFVALVHNKTNLWIGARSGTSDSHLGATFISTGWNPDVTDDYGDPVAYPTIKVSVPKIVDDIKSSDNYDVLHTGNIGETSLTFTSYSRGVFLHDTKRNYAGIYNNGDNLWIGATSGTSYHHLGKTYISAGFTPDGEGGYAHKYMEYPDVPDTGDYAFGNNTIYVSVPLAYGGNSSVGWERDPTVNPEVTTSNYGVIHEGVLINMLDRNMVDLTRGKRYIGYHLAGHLSGSAGDSVFVHRVPIKNLTNDNSSVATISLANEGSINTDINAADNYGRIRIEPIDNSSSYIDVELSFDYDTKYYRYDVFTIEIWENGVSVGIARNLGDATVTLTDNNNNTINGYMQQTDDGVITVNNNGQEASYCKYTVYPLVDDYGDVSDPIPSTSTYIKHVSLSLRLVLGDSSSYNSFYIQACAGNTIRGISHLRSYNHMLVDILARLYKLENPGT